MISPARDLFRENPRHMVDVRGIDAMELEKLMEIVAIGDLGFLGLGFSKPRLLGFVDNVSQLEHIATEDGLVVVVSSFAMKSSSIHVLGDVCSLGPPWIVEPNLEGSQLVVVPDAHGIDQIELSAVPFFARAPNI